MTTAEIRAVLVAMRASTHVYIALRSTSTAPRDRPAVVLLQERNANGLDAAVRQALATRPDCHAWELCGYDLTPAEPGAVAAHLATFTTDSPNR